MSVNRNTTRRAGRPCANALMRESAGKLIDFAADRTTNNFQSISDLAHRRFHRLSPTMIGDGSMSDINVLQKANGKSSSTTTQAEFDSIRWKQLNPWLSEGQADDRTPMNGSVRLASQIPSVQRAFARRSHQAMFKKWSQARHD